jgi:hypothetical protein
VKSHSLAALIALAFAYVSGASAEAIHSASSFKVSQTPMGVEDVLSSAASSISIFEAQAKTATNNNKPTTSNKPVLGSFTPALSFITSAVKNGSFLDSVWTKNSDLFKNSNSGGGLSDPPDPPSATPEPAGTAALLFGILGTGVFFRRRFRTQS